LRYAARALGRGEADTARRVAVDWDGLERALFRRAADSEAYLDARSGEVVYVTRGWSDDHDWSDAELAEGLAAGRLVAIQPVPQATQLGWMHAFAEALDDGWPRDALLAALDAETPPRAFEDALGRFPAERLGWIGCREGRVRAVLRAWLEANDVEPEETPPGLPLDQTHQAEG
jgi:hypothetical protein